MEKLYPQLINEHELLLAKQTAHSLNEEVIVYETGIDRVHALLMSANPNNLLNGERFVQTNVTLEQLGLTKEEAFQLALENLKALPFKLNEMVFPFKFSEIEEEQKFYSFMGNDGFEAARILLVDELTELTEIIQGEYFYGIPSTDMLFIFPSNKAETIAKFMISEFYGQSKEFQLSPNLHTGTLREDSVS